jgi:D-arabinose 1-dehydrogenase-like Zn-dependent alcohol dehydrogenase
MPYRTENVALGHEGVVRIEQNDRGARGKGFKVRDTIGFLYITGCYFEYEGCIVHNVLCEMGKQLLQGLDTEGFFAKYAVVDWQNAIILPRILDPRKSSPILLCENYWSAILICIHTSMSYADFVCQPVLQTS